MSAIKKMNKNEDISNCGDRVPSLNDFDLDKLAFCPTCKSCGDIIEHKQRGSLIIGLIGVLAGGFPGLLYILFYLKNWTECRVCSNKNIATLEEWIKSHPVENEKEFIESFSHYPEKLNTKAVFVNLLKFAFGLFFFLILLLALLVGKS